MVFVLLADEPRKFIYGKRGQILWRCRIPTWVMRDLARAIAFFLTTAFLGPISGDEVNGLRFFYTHKRSKY